MPYLKDGKRLNIQELLEEEFIQKTIKVHDGSTVPVSDRTTSAFIDVSGYKEVAMTAKWVTNGTNQVDIYWSHDGVNIHGADWGSSNTSNYKNSNVPIKAKYIALSAYNADGITAHTVNSWVYLKR